MDICTCHYPCLSSVKTVLLGKKSKNMLLLFEDVSCIVVLALILLHAG